MAKIFDIIEQDSRTEFNANRAKAQRLVKKWADTGLLEGIKKEHDKTNMAVLLENQTKQLITETSATGGVGSEEWSGIALPLVRRVFSEIASKDFVSVQPMTIPSGLVFYIDFKYGTNQPGFKTTESPYEQSNSIYGVTNQSGDATDGLYGAGRFGYSINDYSASISPATSSVSETDVWFNPALSSSAVRANLRRVTVDMTGLNYDIEGTRAFAITNDSTITTYYPAYTTPTDETGAASTTKVTFIALQKANITGTDVVINYQKQPTSSTRGDFEQTHEVLNTPDSGGISDDYVLDIPEINLDMKQKAVVAKTRKLKAVWTPEYAQDLQAYHSIDAEAELASMLSEHVSMEIDMEILDMLIKAASINELYWSARIGEVYNPTTGTFYTQDNQQGRSLSYTQPTWYQTLGIKMQQLSNQIHSKTMRGGANFAVVGPNVATIIESMTNWNADTDGNQESFAMGVQKAGTLNSRFTIYKNPYMTDNLVLMGFRGSQFLETGATYAPYVPLQMTPVIYSETNATPRRFISTRYGKTVTRPEYYGRIIVQSLDYV